MIYRRKRKEGKKPTNKKEFSKVLLIQESILLWILTIASFILAFICVINQYIGDLPWITAMVGFPWTAYGVSQACYYRKSEKENTKNGIKYEATMNQMQNDYGPDSDGPNPNF